MASLAFYTKLRSFFIPRGRMLYTCAKYKLNLKLTSLTSTIQPVQRSVARKTMISQAASQNFTVIRRQLQMKSLQRKDRTLSSLYRWDKISPDFKLIYESGLKNWIWGYYCAQIFIVVNCCCVLYSLSTHLDEMPDYFPLQIMACSCAALLLLSLASLVTRHIFIRIYYNADRGQFVATRRTCFGRLKKMYYTQDDVTLANRTSKDIDENVVVKIKGRRCYLASDCFISPKYYNMHVHSENVKDTTETLAQGPKF